MNQLNEIDWEEKTDVLKSLLGLHSIHSSPLLPGLEAEVIKYCTDDSCFVLKIWNKTSKPNIEHQFRLLQTLYERGLPVPEPCGWGMDRNMNSVLLTSYNGLPIKNINEEILTKIAKMLLEIHRIPLKLFETVSVNKYDFISYFYPEIEKHSDMHELLINLVRKNNLTSEHLIHGDLNLGNVLAYNNELTVIDWTNGQQGDPRYDIAWSVFLLQIYNGESYASFYRKSFIDLFSNSELEAFEAIACIRWILLHRSVGLSKEAETLRRVRGILQKNVHLSENLL